MHIHYVEFLSPGSFVAETREIEIESWDEHEACRLAHGVVERHGATPYGFQFLTRSREDDELDAKVTARSGMYYLGGNVRTIEQVRAEQDPAESILLQNMECNGWKRIVTATNGYKWTQPLKENDIVLAWKPKEPTAA